jgi:hypothetical protein
MQFTDPVVESFMRKWQEVFEELRVGVTILSRYCDDSIERLCIQGENLGLGDVQPYYDPPKLLEKEEGKSPDRKVPAFLKGVRRSQCE